MGEGMLEKLPDVIGHALSDIRAGLDLTMVHAVDLRAGMASLSVGSLAFADHAPIPARYTADGEGISPPLHWSAVPEGSSDLALIVEDADSPTPHPLVHVIAHGIPAADGNLPEGMLRDGGELAMGRNSLLGAGWLPPDPPPGHGAHRYVFQVFAMGPGEPLPSKPGREALHDALVLRGMASGWFIGTYERSSVVPDTTREPAARPRTA